MESTLVLLVSIFIRCRSIICNLSGDCFCDKDEACILEYHGQPSVEGNLIVEYMMGHNDEDVVEDDEIMTAEGPTLGNVQEMRIDKMDKNDQDLAKDLNNDNLKGISNKDEESSDSYPFYDLFAINKHTNVFVEDPDKHKYGNQNTDGNS